MKLTNKKGYPQAIYDAVKNDGYSKGDSIMSISQLLDPPQKVILEQKHDDEIEEDVDDRVWALYGQGIHAILERANRTAIAERRLFMNIEGWLISGAMDLYEEEGILWDYKNTSVYRYSQNGPQDWEEQLNCYAVLLRHHGHKVNRIKVVGIIRDWRDGESVNAAEQGKFYPDKMLIHEISVWPPDEAMKFLRERVILHQQAQIKIPPCTSSEQWVRDELWAVWKQGGKKCINGGKKKTKAEADDFVAQNPGHYVQYRPGMKVRCAKWCNAAPFCTQYQAELTKKSIPENVD
jgi:hypothetical protein